MTTSVKIVLGITALATLVGSGACFYKAWLIHAAGSDADFVGFLCFIGGVILGAGIVNVMRIVHHPLP